MDYAHKLETIGEFYVIYNETMKFWNEIYPNSLLSEQLVIGKRGGNIIQLSLGVMWDERDKDPDTRDGFWSEVSARYSSLAWASDYEMWGMNVTHRQWIPLDRKKLIVWAYRLGVDYQGGQVPFFQKNIMGGSQWVELGGNSAMRGYKRGRLRGDINVYTSQELRWRLGEFHIKKRELAYQITPILDIGYSDLIATPRSQTSWLEHLHTSFGLGARMIYDESFVLRLDFAFVVEQVRVNEQSPSNTQLMPAFFAIVNHTF